MKDKMSDKRESRLGKGLSALLGDMDINEPERKPVGYINRRSPVPGHHRIMATFYVSPPVL